MKAILLLVKVLFYREIFTMLIHNKFKIISQ